MKLKVGVSLTTKTKSKMDNEKSVVASLALHAVLEPVFSEVMTWVSFSPHGRFSPLRGM